MATKRIPIVTDATRKSRQAVPTGRAKKRPAADSSKAARKSTGRPPVKAATRPTKRATPVAKTNPVAVVEAPRKPKISKTDVSKLRSIIGDNVENIQQLLAEGQFEAATTDLHKVLLQSLVDVIPYAESAVRDSEGKRGIYQINSLMSMILETLNSARAQADRGQLAHHLIERVIQPVFKLMAESIVREFQTLESDLVMSDRKDTSKIVRETRTRLADAFQQNYHSMVQAIMKNMAG